MTELIVRNEKATKNRNNNIERLEKPLVSFESFSTYSLTYVNTGTHCELFVDCIKNNFRGSNENFEAAHRLIMASR